MPSDNVTDDHVVLLVRRIHCPECKKYRALEILSAVPTKEGDITVMCNCDDPCSDDELVAKLLEGIRAAFGDELPYVDERAN